MRRLWVAGLLALAGCSATLPTPDGVRTVAPVAGQVAGDDTDLRKIPAGPATDATPLQVVNGWLGASSDLTTADRFLRRGTAWDTKVATMVYDDPPDVQIESSGGSASATVTYTAVGRLQRDGALEAAEGPHRLTLHLAQVGGQWRIDQLPPGVLLPSRELRIDRCPLSLAWLTPDHSATVTQDVLLGDCAPADHVSMAAAAVRALLAGPDQDLAGTMVTAMPAGTAVASAPRILTSGTTQTVVVDLASGDAAPDLVALTQFRTQLERTLVPALGTLTLRLLVDGQPPPVSDTAPPAPRVPVDPGDVPAGVTELPASNPAISVAPDGAHYARLQPVGTGRWAAQVGLGAAGTLPTSWRSVGTPQPWDQVSLDRDGTVWLTRGGQVWAAPATSGAAHRVTSPRPLAQLLPSRDGVHAVGVTTTGQPVALLLRGGTDPAVVADPSAVPGALVGVTGVSSVSAPEADGTVLLQGRASGAVGLWRLHLRLTVDYLVDPVASPLSQLVPSPCLGTTLRRLSLAPGQPDRAWCTSPGGGQDLSLTQGVWTPVGTGGPQVYVGS